MKKQSFKFLFLVTISMFLANCSNDNKVNDSVINKKIDGQELFKSIIFLDGELTQKIPSLQNICIVNNLSSVELIKLRKTETEALNYLKKLDANYFNKFQTNIYTKDPEVIEITIKKAIKDMDSFVDSKLSLLDLSIEKISRNVNKGKHGGFDIGKTQITMEKLLLGYNVYLFVASVTDLVVNPYNQVNTEVTSLQIATAI